MYELQGLRRAALLGLGAGIVVSIILHLILVV
jgi:hypothetical protein